MAEQFKWVGFYMEFATKLLEYKTDRGSLIEKLQKVYSDIGMKLPKLEKDNIILQKNNNETVNIKISQRKYKEFKNKFFEYISQENF